MGDPYYGEDEDYGPDLPDFETRFAEDYGDETMFTTNTNTPFITTTRDREPAEYREIADTLYDLRAGLGRAEAGRLVRRAAARLGWTEARVWDAVNKLAEEK